MKNRFLIITHVHHIKKKEKFYAYPPYVREMNIWLKYVKNLEIVAPLHILNKRELVEGDPYQHSNLNFTELPSFNFLSLNSGIKAVFKIPVIFIRIWRAMFRADHIHIRSPGNNGLIACLVQIFFPGKTKTAKYAGNWDTKAKQPFSYKMQKWILSNGFLTRNMTVLVYGNWPNLSKNLLPFFTASFEEDEKEVVIKTISAPYRFLFVGNLVEGKNPLVAIKIIEHMITKGIEVNLEIYGKGPLRAVLQKYVSDQGLSEYVYFKGNRKLNELKQAYKDAHFQVLVSKSEGWPKAVAEAMFFGCIPIATSVSCVPWMLGEGTRGILIPPPDKNSGADVEEKIEEIVNDIVTLIENPDDMRRMSLKAQNWSQEYTLEKFETAVLDVLAHSRNVTLEQQEDKG